MKKKEYIKIFYKLCVDTFVFLLIVCSGFLVAEALLPGIISRYIPTMGIFALSIAVLLIIKLLWDKEKTAYSVARTPWWVFVLLCVFFVTLLLNAVRAFPLATIIPLAVLCVALFVLFYKMLMEK